MYKSLKYLHPPAYVYCVLYAGLYSLTINQQSFMVINQVNKSTAVPEKN